MKYLPTLSMLKRPRFELFDVLSVAPEDGKRLQATAYLDGLRGFASVFVIAWHFSLVYFHRCNYGYGITSDNEWFFQLPIIRNMWAAGAGMVCLFFVCGGIVLSAKPLRYMQSGQHENLLKCLSGSILRRPARLFLPPIASTFIVALIAMLGWHYSVRPQYAMASNEPSYFFDKPEYTAWTIFLDWLHETSIWSKGVFSHGNMSHNYDLHIWTITLELQGSFLIYLLCLMTARLSNRGRYITLLLCITFNTVHGLWWMNAFAGGMCISMHLANSPTSSKSLEDDLTNLEPAIMEHDADSALSSLRALRQRVVQLLWAILFLGGLYLTGIPRMEIHRTPGYRWLSNHQYGQWCWQTLGAVCVVLATTRLRFVQRICESRLAQYFGRVSFSSYLLHGPVFNTIGFFFFQRLFYYTNVADWSGKIHADINTHHYAAVVALGFFGFLGPLLFLCAELFERHIDQNIVSGIRFLEQKIVH